MQIHRRFLDPVHPHADSNIRRHYAIEDAAWVWHPRLIDLTPVVLQFTRAFQLDAPTRLDLHVTADERYELRLDGQHISSGPHRSDWRHWAFSSFTIDLPPGAHTLEAIVWRLGQLAPSAQISLRGGFILACEQRPDLNTGNAHWRVQQRRGHTFTPYRDAFNQYHATGPQETIDLAAQQHQQSPPIEPLVVRPAIADHSTGVPAPGWQLYPSPLPEMIRQPRRAGIVRTAEPSERTLDQPVRGDRADQRRVADWQALIDGKQTLEIPAHSTEWLVIELEDYLCGYPWIVVSDGAGSDLRIEWAESLYQVDQHGRPTKHKGQRQASEGKRFLGFGDGFRTDGDDHRNMTTLWWRAGRMLRVIVRTADQPLRLETLNILETRYPLEYQGRWQSDDHALQRFVPIAVRGMQMCSHETYMDCPYYEQMMYVGDGRLELLVNYVMSADDRLAHRSLTLFDWSRLHNELVAERYPSDPYQLSVTFSMIWVLAIRDYAWWHDDAPFVRQRLLGVRALLDQILALRQDDGLLHHLPGWSFLDWVPQWTAGAVPPGAEGQPLAIVNLLFLLALQAGAQLEQAYGEAELAARDQRLANALSQAIVATFWDQDAQLIRDAPACTSFSEHAQCLALLADAVPSAHRQACFDALTRRCDLAPTTVYFCFYLLETLYRFDRGDLLHQKLDFWKHLADLGFATPVEKPEPSRSDCHAWGSHPLFHLHASLAGIRPLAPGFRQVLIAPSPGPLRSIQCRQPHPRGQISLDLKRDSQGNLTATIDLPPQTTGIFRWDQTDYPLQPGKQTLTPATTPRR